MEGIEQKTRKFILKISNENEERYVVNLTGNTVTGKFYCGYKKTTSTTLPLGGSSLSIDSIKTEYINDFKKCIEVCKMDSGCVRDLMYMEQKHKME